MNVHEFSWKNDNGNKVYAVEWPVETPRAVVGLIHGIGENIRRYDGVAAFFQRHDIATVGYDRQGFGRSEGRRGYAKNYREYLDEVARLVVKCQNHFPDVPVFLYGHSMGGQLLLQYLTRRHPDVSGAIVSAPHITLAFEPTPILVSLGKLMRRVYPSFTQENQLDLEALSRDPTVKEDYLADPYNHNKISSQIGIDMLERAAELNAYDRGLNVPTLLMHGDRDRITGYGGSANFAERNDNAEFKPWPDFFHELHLEPEKEEVLEYVLEWLVSHLKSVHRPPASV